jgi:putative ABC transport system substrate-binding protein
VAARAQQPEQMRRVGVLMVGPESDPEQQAQVAVFQQVLGQLGWVEGRNLKTYVQWAVADQLGALEPHNRSEPSTKSAISRAVKELVALEPDVILASPTVVLIPLQRETSSIPIVFVGVSDPLAQGIVTSLARPTGNVTGFSNPQFSLVGKSLQMLKDIAPDVSRVALIISAANGSAAAYFRAFNTVATSFAVTPVTAAYRDRTDIERAIEAFSRQPNGGLVLPRDTTTNLNRDLIVELAARYRLPAVYAQREIVASGGLMSYGIEPSEAFQGAASYVDRILRGAKPSDLPVQEPTRFEFVINLKTAKGLGLTIPPSIQMTADAVIE